MRGAAYRAGPVRGRIDIGTGGAAWQSLEGLPCPRVFGFAGRNFDDITGVLVGAGPDGDAPGAVLVQRLPAEAYFDGVAPSLLQRCAALHGTLAPWRLQYRA
jgi:hypothetical protein